jgi:hypothetical protein
MTVEEVDESCCLRPALQVAVPGSIVGIKRFF